MYLYHCLSARQALNTDILLEMPINLAIQRVMICVDIRGKILRHFLPPKTPDYKLIMGKLWKGWFKLRSELIEYGYLSAMNNVPFPKSFVWIIAEVFASWSLIPSVGGGKFVKTTISKTGPSIYLCVGFLINYRCPMNLCNVTTNMC